MISLSAESCAKLSQHLARPSVEVFITLPINGVPTTYNLTRAVDSVAALRTSLQPLSRSSELSNVSIMVRNDLVAAGLDRVRYFSPFGQAGSLFYDASKAGQIAFFHGAKVQVKMGWGADTVTVMTGQLVDIQLDDQGGAELIISDPLAKLKKDTVKLSLVYEDPDGTPGTGDETGVRFTNVPPAWVIRRMLSEAGFLTDWVDDASLLEGVFRESSEGFLLDEYAIRSGTWWQTINAMLEAANASLKWGTSGVLEYFKWRPTRPDKAADYILDSARNCQNVRIRQPEAGVINSATAQKSDGAGGRVATTASPIQDSTSISRHGERNEDFPTDFLDDFPADQVASEAMFYQAEFPTVISLEGLGDAFLVELGDVVQVFDRGTGADGILATVFQKSINPTRGVTSLLAMDTFLTSKPWVWTENSQKPNNTGRIW